MPSHGRKPPNPQKIKPSPRARRKPVSPGSRTGRDPDACCPMVAAIQSAKQGKFRLARRYAAMSVGLILARIGRVT